MFYIRLGATSLAGEPAGKGTLVFMFLGADRAGVRYCAGKQPPISEAPFWQQDGGPND